MAVNPQRASGARLAGKVALIAGEFAPFGPGGDEGVVSNEWALALTCAREGARVVVADADGAAAGAIAAALEGRGFEAAGVACEVTEEADCQAAVRAAEARFGALHLMVNLVGAPDMQTIGTLASADLEALLRVHVVGNFNLLKHGVEAMRRAGGGAAVTVSSLSAVRTGGAGLGYETAKAALLAMTRNVALSEASAGIRVNAILPGALDSAAFRHAVGDDVSGFGARIPLGRLGTPWDLARGIAFLLSEDAAFVTGAQLLVDGGMAWRV